MEIIIAEHSGFCEGVSRAYKIALEQAKLGKNVYMLGNLVHNTQVVEKLKSLGIKSVKSLSEIPKETPGIILISAHGVSPEIYTRAESIGFEIVDTTCPWVKNAQKLAKELAGKDIDLVIVGDREHPEVKGLVGWSNNKAIVVEKPEEIDGLKKNKDIVGVIAQTTQSEENFNAVIKKLESLYKNVIVHKTICGATHKRQSAAIELAKKVGLMLVIGDAKSANTKRLAELCKSAGCETYQIQTKSELNKDWTRNAKKIGITAGASTPDWVVQEILGLIQPSPGML